MKKFRFYDPKHFKQAFSRKAINFARFGSIPHGLKLNFSNRNKMQSPLFSQATCSQMLHNFFTFSSYANSFMLNFIKIIELEQIKRRTAYKRYRALIFLTFVLINTRFHELVNCPQCTTHSVKFCSNLQKSNYKHFCYI